MARRGVQTPYPAWYGEERHGVRHLWCHYHDGGQGSWLRRETCFQVHRRRPLGEGERRACDECDAPGLRRIAHSDEPTLEQCYAFFPYLSSRRQTLWRTKLYDDRRPGDGHDIAVGLAIFLVTKTLSIPRSSRLFGLV